MSGCCSDSDSSSEELAAFFFDFDFLGGVFSFFLFFLSGDDFEDFVVSELLLFLYFFCDLDFGYCFLEEALDFTDCLSLSPSESESCFFFLAASSFFRYLRDFSALGGVLTFLGL